MTGPTNVDFAKLANLAMDCEFGNGLRSWQSGLRIWQGGLRIWQWVANLAKWFAKLAKWFAKLAMRIFAKLLKFLCEKRSSQMHSECG